MANQVKLKLGDFTFSSLEIPSKIVLGGEQKLVIHELVGGRRIVDAMGKVYEPLKWNGLFLGSDALPKAKYFDLLRKLGMPLKLTWSTMSYVVIIQQFLFDFEKETQIPYAITCVVITDDSDKESTDFLSTVDEEIVQDVIAASEAATALRFFKQVDAVKIQTKMSFLASLIADIKGFAGSVMSQVKAVQDQIQAVKDTITDIQDDITIGIASVSNTIQNITTLGGVLPYNPVSINALNLSQSALAFTNSYNLLNIKYSLMRVDRNIKLLNPYKPSSSIATITVMNCSLYELASKYYGDATQWETIAKANGITDPFINSEMTLIIPKA